MIGWKLIYSTIAAVAYISLLSGFFNIFFGEQCSYSSPCVRFCQSDRKVISDDELMKKFKSSDLYKDEYSFYNYRREVKVKMIRAELKCKNVSTYEELILRPVKLLFFKFIKW